MQFYIIRHCQSYNNALWYRTGSSDGRQADPALTEIGRHQAEHLANYIASFNGTDLDQLDRFGIDITHLYCSLMNRSIETGLHIAKAIDLPLMARDDIHERGGIYLEDPQTAHKNGLDGPNRDYFSEHYPAVALPDTLGTAGWWNRPYEDHELAISRARSFLEWLLATHDGTDDRVAIVTHAGFAQSLFSLLFDIPPLESNLGTGRNIWIKFNNGSITRLDFLDDVLRLSYQNRVEFLPADLVT